MPVPSLHIPSFSAYTRAHAAPPMQAGRGRNVPTNRCGGLGIVAKPGVTPGSQSKARRKKTRQAVVCPSCV